LSADEPAITALLFNRHSFTIRPALGHNKGRRA
jgi:hypothetical protein